MTVSRDKIKKVVKSLPSSTKMLVLFVFIDYSEYGRDNFLFHLSSIKFTSGVIFNKARFSANKAALLKIKRALLTNKCRFLIFG